MSKTIGYGETTITNVTEPFTVMLTNEAQQFATDSNRKVTSAQSYYTDIIVIQGTQERKDYTIGTITSGSNITVSKSGTRVTFSVSAGTTISADAGVIEIPITLDGQTVKKQFSWSCGKQGPQGIKGEDGTSVKITSKSVTYQASTSGTTAPTGTWSTSVPTVNNGQYLWTKTTVQYSDGNKTEAYSVSYKGTNGTNGTSVTVSKTEVTYQVSTSGTTAPTGTWSTTMPTCDQGLYLWAKTYVQYSDGKNTTSYSVSYKGVDGEKFAFNMLRETNQGSKHWRNSASGGKYSVESVTTEDGVNAVKLICTEAIPSGGWQFTHFDDFKMLETLKPSTDYTLSFDIKSNLGARSSYITIQQGSATNAMTNSVLTPIKGDETWEHICVNLKTVSTLPTINLQCVYITSLGAVGYSIIKNLKLTESTIDTPWAPHPADLEGRGVTETVQYYLATSQASGVTSSTSGWSTDISTQKITSDKKYLWNCYQTKYSDGTSEPISTPKIIGVYGDKGETGAAGKDGEDGAGFHWNLLSGTDISYDYSYPSSNYIDRCTWTTPKLNGDTYTMSFYAKSTVAGDKIRVHFYNPSNIKSVVGSQGQKSTATDGLCDFTLSTTLERYWVTYTIPANGNATRNIILARIGAKDNTQGVPSGTGTITISKPKLEEGDKASPWCTTYEETLAKSISITPSAQYFKSTDGGKTFAPNNITITPTIQGEISFGKWQYSIDGGVSFADVVSGQKGLTISNNVLTVSKDSSLYSDAVTMVTFRAVANDSSFYDTCSIAKIYDVSDIQIGGRNLARKGCIALWDTSTTLNDDTFSEDGSATFSRKSAAVNAGVIIDRYVNYEQGQQYVISFKMKVTSGTVNSFYIYNQIGHSNNSVYIDGVKSGVLHSDVNFPTDEQYHQITVYFTATSVNSTAINGIGVADHLILQPIKGTAATYTVQLLNFKIEKGNYPTDWTPTPEDVQTAILSTKSEISDVSLKVDNNKEAIEQRVEKTTYQQDLTLVKGDISKANEGLNKWRYEIYPKSLFADKPEDQSKITLDVFARNKNIIPTQSILLDDTKLGQSNYGDNYIGYAVTFVKMSEATKLETTFVHDDAGSFYLNGKLV